MQKARLMVFGLLILVLCWACTESDDDPITDGDELTGDSDQTIDGDSDAELETDGDVEAEFLLAEELGPYNIGGFRYTFTEPARDRTLPGTVWYPTEVEGEEQLRYQGALPFGNCQKEVDPAPGGPFPLIIFSHGHQAFDAQSYFLTEHLASHGYIIAACDHVEDTTATSEDQYLAKSAMDRPKDVSLLIDTLLEWNETPGHMLEGKINPEQIGVAGHSFGAYTSIAVLGPPVNIQDFVDRCTEIGEENWKLDMRFCKEMRDADMSYVEHCTPCVQHDTRIKASVPMTPAALQVFVPGSFADIDVPVLAMAGERDTTATPNEEVKPFFEQATHPETMYWELANAGHFAFSNMCDILGSSEFGLEYGCGEGYIDSERAWNLINTATLAFFNIHLRNDERYRKYFEQDYLDTAPEITLLKKQ